MSEIRSQATPARDELAADIARAAREIDECFDIAHESKELADRLRIKGWSKPRTVNTAAEAEALAEGSVILDARGEVLHWIDRGDYLQWSDIWGNECGADYPATVLFTPGDAG